MSLSDPRYLAFLFAIVILFYLLRPGTLRLLLLLGASYLFYFNLSGYYAAVLLFVTAATYAGGLLLRAGGLAARRGLLFASMCVVVLMPLIVFKYLAFVLGAVAGVVTVVGFPVSSPVVALALPIGISFFTFAALGYLIDVYLDVIDPERDVLRLALFVAFFPLVTAGPIERGDRLLPQLGLDMPFSSERALAGLRMIFIGLVLKVLFADSLVVPVNAIYGDLGNAIPLEKLFALIYYMFYIYADFAGYSLIAIGSAKMLGLEVRPNFEQPYLSATVPEFWRTWHISLSSWVRDYLFTPLRMRWRASGGLGLVGAIVLSFLILGVWHGAGWGFALFGLMHGVLVVASTYTRARRDALWSTVGLPRPVLHVCRVIVTFVAVMLTFVVYRASSMHDAALIYRDIFSVTLLQNLWYGLKIAILHPAEPMALAVMKQHVAGWGLIALIVLGDILVHNKITLGRLPKLAQLAAYNIGAGLLVYKWVSGSVAEPFLYYKF